MAAGSRKKGTGKKTAERKRTSPARSAGGRASGSRASGSRTSGRKKTGSAGAGKEKAYTDYAVGEEIRILLVLAFSVLILLGNVGLGGRFGAVMRGAMFGVFGLMAWALPFVIFFGYAFFVANRGNSLLLRKMLGLILTVLFLCAFMHILTLGYSRSVRIADYYEICADERTGGGVIGGTLIFGAGYVFGSVGAWIVTVFGLVISAIILTQRPLLRTIGKTGRRAAGAARKRRAARSERREAARTEYEKLLREEEEEYREEFGFYEDEPEYPEPDLLDPGLLEQVTLPGGGKRRSASRSGEKKRPAAPTPAEKKRKGAKPAAPQPSFEEPAFLQAAHEMPASRQDAPEPPAFQQPAFLQAAAKADAEPQSIRIDGQEFKMPSFLTAGAPSLDGFLKEEPDREESGSRPEDNPETGTGVPGPEAQSAPEDAPDEVPPAAAGAEAPADGTPKKEDGAQEPDARKTKKASPKEKMEGIENIRLEIANQQPARPVYRLPSTSLLKKGGAAKGDSRQYLMNTAAKLQKTLETFGVNVKVVNVSRGPTVTRYELQPEMGVKVSRIINLQDDIQLNLATSGIRIEAPIPGKAAVGIEVPNKETSPVYLRDMFESEEFKKTKAHIPFAVGKDLGGRIVIADIEKMPHLLIAGATGSGKSVCINTLIMSILYKCTPAQVRFLMIDPKVVELKIDDGIPHLLIPVVTDAKKAAGALNWAVQEMTERYAKFAALPGVRDIRSYNERIEKENAGAEDGKKTELMPRIVVIVDELADLMMVASSEVEDAICRLAQLARAAGIHLIIATQRPSVNVVTGLIKANMPSRIALAVTSGIDSRTILDMNGAEKLLGKGDMLFYPQGYPKPARVQGGYVSDEEITGVVDFLSSQSDDSLYNKEVEERISGSVAVLSAGQPAREDDRDEYFEESGRLIIEKEKASIGMLQRAFKIGFNRAARIMDQLSEAGVVGGEEGTKPRKILMTMEEFEQILQDEV